VPAKRGGRVAFTTGAKAVRGTIVASRGHYLRVRWDESGRTDTMHPTWHIVLYRDTRRLAPEVAWKSPAQDGLPACCKTTAANSAALDALPLRGRHGRKRKSPEAQAVPVA
jgi:hypothetical protein